MKVSEVPDDGSIYLDFVKDKKAFTQQQVFDICCNMIQRNNIQDMQLVGVFVTYNNFMPGLVSYQCAMISPELLDRDIYDVHEYSDVETTVFLPLTHFKKCLH